MKAPNGFKKGVGQWANATEPKPRKKSKRGVNAFNKLRGYYSSRNAKPSFCIIYHPAKNTAG